MAGAEDRSAVALRLQEGLVEIEEKHQGSKIVVVTHGGILNTIHKMVTGEKYPGKIPNTSIGIISKGKGDKHWKVDQFACCTHMEGKVEFDSRAFGGICNTG